MENSKNSTDCCSTSETNSNCCSSVPSKNETGMKKKTGVGVLAIAFVLAITSAFTLEPANSGAEKVYCETSSINDYKWLKTTEKVALVLVKSNDETMNKKFAEEAKEFVNEINNANGSASFHELEPGSEGYLDVVKKENIEEFPAVVIIGRKTKSSVISGSITSIKLIRAYDLAITPVSSCSAKQKQSCCSKK